MDNLALLQSMFLQYDNDALRELLDKMGTVESSVNFLLDHEVDKHRTAESSSFADEMLARHIQEMDAYVETPPVHCTKAMCSTSELSDGHANESRGSARQLRNCRGWRRLRFSNKEMVEPLLPN